MHKNIFIAGIICLSILSVFTCFWIVNQLVEGIDFNEFVEFPNLVVIDGINALLCEIIFLMYLRWKKYKISFAISLLSTITFLILYASIYNFFTYDIGSGNFINLFATVHLTAVTMFSLSFVISNASERPLLKQAGYIGSVVGLIILITHISTLYMTEGVIMNTLIYINLGFSRLGEFIVIFYILNFYQELRSDVKPALQI